MKAKDVAIPPDHEDELLVHSFGVGHGDCTLVEFRHKKVVAFRLLCDAGAGPGLPQSLRDHLRDNAHSKGRNFIDLVVLTHVDKDHQGGLPALFVDDEITVREYWGPCLPAFRRLSPLFAPRVATAVERASELEAAITKRGVEITYPLEGHSIAACDRQVAISVVSPATRLIRQLLSGSLSSVANLLTAAHLPLEWLIAGANLEQEPEENLSAPDLRGRVHLTPDDFLGGEPRPLRADTALLRRQAAEAYGTGYEPNFFGNTVLNDTSLIVVVDVFLDRKRRRRVLLTGDQENWSYIASRHPAGLGLDVLKVPHHGGSVYLADKQEEDAIEQTYLWLRPRIAVVSAMGRHSLPHVRVREALRLAGATLFCPNRRTFEPLSPGATLANDRCCHAAYGCGGDQTAALTVRLTAHSESGTATACLQGTIHRGPAPIVVQTQRIVEPDEAFIRWSRTEVEKQAKWLRKRLDQRHDAFLSALARSSSPHKLMLAHEGVPWETLETQARADGQYHLAADPIPVLRFAVARLLIQQEENTNSSPTRTRYYRPFKRDEIAHGLAWLRSIPHVLATIDGVSMNFVESENWTELLMEADLGFISSAMSFRLKAPPSFIGNYVMPQVFDVLRSNFNANICAIDSTYNPYLRDGCKAVLHLWRKNEAIPDIFDSTWCSSFWDKDEYEVSEETLDFLFTRAESDVLLASFPTDRPQARDRREALGTLAPKKPECGPDEAPDGQFQVRLREARWTKLWAGANLTA
jgi:beta-lactamase superfamily II metal-dependent hydrolase